MLPLICFLWLGGVLWELVLSQTSQFCCLWNVYNSSYRHIYFLKDTSMPFVIHLNPARTSLICKTDNMILTFNGDFSCLQTFLDTLYESELGMRHRQVWFCWIIDVALPAKDTNCDEEIRKHKTDQEECGPLLSSVNILGVVCYRRRYYWMIK